jgi:hypothetical protein
MKYHIKEWTDQTASLIAEDGYELDVFNNLCDAIKSCVLNCMVEPDYIESHTNYLGKSPVDFEASYL